MSSPRNTINKKNEVGRPNQKYSITNKGIINLEADSVSASKEDVNSSKKLGKRAVSIGRVNDEFLSNLPVSLKKSPPKENTGKNLDK
jgi:hypothetical protein